MYYMTRDGFTFLVMGFTGKVAAQFKEDYINAFNRMEAELKTPAAPKVKPSVERARTLIRRALDDGFKRATDAYTLKWYREQYDKERLEAMRLREFILSIAHQLQNIGIRPELG